MREIKFRAWKKSESRYVLWNELLSNPEHHVLWNELLSNPEHLKLALERIMYESLEQFTGLHDKNGKEIYEGDIVKANDCFEDVVEFNAAAFIFEGREHATQGTVIRAWSELEIIGNIHDNAGAEKETTTE